MKKVILIIGVILTAGFSSVRTEVILDTLDERKLTFGKAECVNLTRLADYYFDSDIEVILRIDDYWKSAFKEICGQLKRERIRIVGIDGWRNCFPGADYYGNVDRINIARAEDDYEKKGKVIDLAETVRKYRIMEKPSVVEEPKPASVLVEVNTFFTVINEGGRASSDSIARIMNKINEKNLELVFCFNYRADAKKAKKRSGWHWIKAC